jgi:hypothetical protein
MSVSATKIEKQGRDLVINDHLSIPKDHALVYQDDERDSVMISLIKSEYSTTNKTFENLIEFKWDTCTKPVGTSTADLFDKISKLKTP